MAEVVDNASHRRRLMPALRGHAAYDIVHIGEYGLAPLLPTRRENRWAVTFNNIPSDVARQAALVAPGRRQRWLWERERAKALRFEHWVGGAFDMVMTVSDEDAASLPGATIVVPNGVDTTFFRPTPLPAAPRLFFSGTLGYLPNADGLAWFCTDVLPRVRAVVPEATLEIVGRLPIPEVLALAHHPGVEIHVDVPSVVPHLTRARVAVVPLRIGSGTRLKALEAMAAGRPIAGTTIGLEGLGIVPGRHALVADEPDSLAASIVDLLRDENLASQLVGRARSFVEERFGWDRIATAFVNALLSAASAGHRPHPGAHP